MVLDNLSTGHKSAVPQESAFIQGDIQDENLLDHIFSEYPIANVIHLAASCYVRESVVNPLKYYQNNVAATISLLNKMLHYKVNKLVFSSTCAVYGIPNAEKIDETIGPAPVNPYGQSKLMTEQIIKDLSKAAGLEFMILRYFNVAGADPDGTNGEQHDPEPHLIPNILLHFLGRKDKITVYGDDYETIDGTCIRDYLHVSDLVSAHILALQSLKTGRHINNCYNVGSGNGYSIKQVIEMCESITGQKADIIYMGRRKGDPPKLVSSTEKIRHELGWEPHYSLKDIIATAWNWHSFSFNN